MSELCYLEILWFYQGLYYFQFDGVQLELFPIDKQPEPRIVRIADDIVALGREKQTIFFNSSGKPTYKNAVIWSEQPVIVG